MVKADGIGEIRKVVIINGKLALQGAIGDAAVLVQHGDRLAEDFIERHSSSSAWGSLYRTPLRPPRRPEHESGLHTRGGT